MNPNLFPVDHAPKANKNIIAAGPLSKQPGTRAFRIVIVQRGSEYIVYSQAFAENEDGSVNWEKPDFSSGDYKRDLVEATKVFAERVARNAGTLASIFRDEPIEV